MKKGFKVICINDEIPDPMGLFHEKPIAGEKYTVREVILVQDTKQVGFLLKELKNPLTDVINGHGQYEPSFNSNRFVLATSNGKSNTQQAEAITCEDSKGSERKK